MFILEYIKTIDDNGNRITITEDSLYARYGNMKYDDREDADQDRILLMENTTNIYIRVREVNE